MQKTLENVMQDAMALPTVSRAFMAEKLIESLDVLDENVPLSPTWKKEINKRCSEIDKGIAKLSSADLVFKKVFSALS
jgi:putative addiction module component (TIGR02574 family)